MTRPTPRRPGAILSLILTRILWPGVLPAATLLLVAMVTLPRTAAALPAGPRIPLAVEVSLAKAECTLGERIMARVAIANRGEVDLRVKRLAFDRQSVDFDIVLDGPELEEPVGPFRFTRIHRDVDDPEDYGESTLKPGGELETTVEIPAIVAGTMKITARYSGVILDDVLPFTLVSNTVAVEVKGTPGASLHAELTTRVGNIVFRLLPDEAPATVMNFCLLAGDEFYDGLLFHRVVENFVVQTGCPQGNGAGGPGYNVPAEIRGKHKHVAGAVAMARSDHFDSAGSQFYICLEPQESLDGWYTVFGEVVSGMDAVKKIEPHHAIEKARIVIR